MSCGMSEKKENNSAQRIAKEFLTKGGILFPLCFNFSMETC